MSWLLTLVDQEQVVMSDQLQQNTWHEKNDNFNERKKKKISTSRMICGMLLQQAVITRFSSPSFAG